MINLSELESGVGDVFPAWFVGDTKDFDEQDRVVELLLDDVDDVLFLH